MKPPTLTKAGLVIIDGEEVPPQQAREYAFKILGLATKGDEIRLRLRGGDRFVFSKDGTVYTAHYRDDSRLLYAYVVGRRRSGRAPMPCSSCSAPLEQGTTAYKPILPMESDPKRTLWREVHLCAGCVEAAPGAKTRHGFRLIIGGAS